MYQDKEAQYFSHARTDLLRLLPDQLDSVLELGAGAGATIAELKRSGGARRVVGVEPHAVLVPEYASLVDEWFDCSAEEAPTQLKGRSFDALLLGDILEHLVDPWEVLRNLKALVRPGGLVVASLPNIRHYSVLKAIALRGDFRYAAEGILDRTHLRFFCPKNMRELFVDSGYTVDSLSSSLELEPGSKKARLNWLSRGRAESFLAFRYYLTARPRTE